MRPRKPLLEIAHESIDYQVNSTFFPELTECFRRLIDGDVFSMNTIDRYGIAETIKKHTGISIKLFVEHNPLNNASIQFRSPTGGNIFDDWFKLFNDRHVIDEWRLTADKLRKLDPGLTGTIDLSKGRVSGIFSKIRCNVTLYTGLLEGSTPEECAATLLHELGHYFNYVWVYTKTVTANLAIYSASNTLSKTQSKVERFKLVEEFVSVAGAKIDDINTVVDDEKSSEEYQAILLQASTRYLSQPEANTYFYDLTANEAMADRFAVMWGAGRALATDLDKYYLSSSRRYKQTLTQHLITEATAMAMSSLKNTVKLLFPPCWFFWPITTISSLNYAFRDVSSYDTPLYRIERIRQGMIQALKDKSLPAELRKNLTDDIAFIESLVDGAKDYRSVFDIIWTSLTKARRFRFNQTQFQKELEFTINNNLFVHSARLSQLTSPQETKNAV